MNAKYAGHYIIRVQEPGLNGSLTGQTLRGSA